VGDADGCRRAARFRPDQESGSGPAVERAGGNLADTAGEGPQGGVHGPPQRWEGPGRSGAELADTEGSGREGRRVPTRHVGPGLAEPPGLGAWPPGPGDRPGWERWIAQAGPEPAVRRDADGLASRLDRLHTIGNGVVPVVAAAAFVRLARRAGLTGRA
jgi:DNA (cytosine-5)-methyltransferase 1